MYDRTRYDSLLVRAEFDPGFRNGTWQDLSRKRTPGVIDAAPTWRRANNWTALTGGTIGASYLNASGQIDVTQDFWCECCFYTGIPGDVNLHLISQLTVNNGYVGGFTLSWDSVAGTAHLDLYDGGAAVARSITTPAGSVVPQGPYHALIGSRAGGTAGSAWINGVPVVATLAGAGVAAVVAGLTAVGFMTSSVVGVVPSASELVARATYGQPSNEDVAALWGACRDDFGIFGVVT